MAFKPDVVLQGHQARIGQKVVANKGTALLGWAIGSGKTLGSLAAHHALKDAGMGSRSLIVVPAKLRRNFADDIKKFTDDKYVIYGNKEEQSSGLYSGIDDPIQEADHHLVSYDLFRQDPHKWIERVKPDTLIFDELHRAKNEYGVTHEAIKNVRPKVKNAIGLSASFVGNSPADVVGILNAIVPTESPGWFFPRKREDFERKFLEPVKGGFELKNHEELGQLLSKFVDYHGPGAKGYGQRGVVPEKRIQEVKVEMSPRQEQLMRYVFDQLPPLVKWKLKKNVEGLSDKEIRHVFSKITAARQVSNSIHTLDPSISPMQAARETPKVRKVLDDVEQHLKETPDGQVLLVSHLIHGGADVLHAGLEDRGISHGMFLGAGRLGLKEEEAHQAVADYNAKKKKVLIISDAGAEGLNLPDTTFIGVLDGHFNPERINQIEGRGIRTGGQPHRPENQREVMVRRYMTSTPGGIRRMLSNFAKRLVPFGLAGSPDNTRAVDRWIYDAAKMKDAANTKVRQALAKLGEEPLLRAPNEVTKQRENEAALYTMDTARKFHGLSRDVDVITAGLAGKPISLPSMPGFSIGGGLLGGTLPIAEAAAGEAGAYLGDPKSYSGNFLENIKRQTSWPMVSGGLTAGLMGPTPSGLAAGIYPSLRENAHWAEPPLIGMAAKLTTLYPAKTLPTLVGAAGLELGARLSPWNRENTGFLDQAQRLGKGLLWKMFPEKPAKLKDQPLSFATSSGPGTFSQPPRGFDPTPASSVEILRGFDPTPASDEDVARAHQEIFPTSVEILRGFDPTPASDEDVARALKKRGAETKYGSAFSKLNDAKIPEEFVCRGTRQMNTGFKDLPNKEKASDRDQTKEVMAVVDDFLKPGTNKDRLVKRLAALSHEQWSGWMKYLFSKTSGEKIPASLHKLADSLSVLLRVKDPGSQGAFKHLQDTLSRSLPVHSKEKTDPHFTLAYAQMKPDEIEAALPRLQEAVSKMQIIPRVAELGSFKGPQDHVLHLKSHDPELREAHNTLKSILKEHGARFTFRGFKPHMTIGRTDKAPKPEELARLNQRIQPRLPVQETEIVISRKKRGGEWEKLNSAIKLGYPIPAIKEEYWRRFGEKLDRNLNKGGRPSHEEKSFLAMLHHGAKGDLEIPEDLLEILQGVVPNFVTFLQKHRGSVDQILSELSPEDRALVAKMCPEEALRHVRGKIASSVDAGVKEMSLRSLHVPEEGKKSLPLGLSYHPARVVAQRHLAKKAGDHFDIRIIPEGSDVAYSFATRHGLPESTHFGRKWFHQPDHTAAYADFEGHIPKGQYGHGDVTKAWEAEGYLSDQTRDGETVHHLTLTSGPMVGRFILSKSPLEEDQKKPGTFLVNRLPDLPLAWKERGKYKQAPSEDLWDNPEWISEAKEDGAHGLMQLTPLGNSFTSIRKSVSGGLIPWHDKVPHLRDLKTPTELDGMVVRGEMVHPKGFSTLSGILNSKPVRAVRAQKQSAFLTFVPWEIVKLPGGKDPGAMPYLERRALLEKFVQTAGSKHLRLPEASMNKRDLYNRVVESGGEGIVLKRLDGGPDSLTVKIKKEIERDLRIVGITPGRGKYEGFGIGALVAEDRLGNLVHVSSGLSDSNRKMLLDNFDKFRGKLIKVRAQEATPTSLRAPRFAGWTVDKSEPDFVGETQ